MRIEVRPLILEKLKQRTCIHHEREVRTSIFYTLIFQWKSTETFYKNCGAFISHLEVLIANGKEWPLSLNFDRRKKKPLLEYDLYVLGYRSLCLSYRSAECTSISLMYLVACNALEGATLGGQIIARHIRKRSGLDQTTGCSYFCSYGAETNSMWNTFCHVLATYASSSALENQMLQAGDATFVKFNAWLEEGREDVTHHTAVLFISFIRKETSMNTASIQESTNLANCEKEPISTPGSIQSHGILIVLQEPDLTILQISSNTMSPEALLLKHYSSKN